MSTKHEEMALAATSVAVTDGEEIPVEETDEEVAVQTKLVNEASKEEPKEKERKFQRRGKRKSSMG